ncbi:MAG TPA: hypothetical protein RMH99_14975 [Sandaracinaceae bacterium LLY-WYZ-13_1]|nr:hypothetical protein [Sandaracinaceae bacterium LLY-WYZ-13_1]
MQDDSTRYAAAIARIAQDRPSCRELLWLRAREKGDTLHARRLLAVDPTIPVRLRYFHDADFRAIDALDPKGRRDAYAALYDFHLDWLLGQERSAEARLERRRLARALTGARDWAA